MPTPEGLAFRVFGMTDVGLVREHNEDNFMIADLSLESGPLPSEQVIPGTVSSRGIAFAVCDGMGGAAAGEQADYFIANVAFAATAATLWWFGDRAPRPPSLTRGR